MDIVTLAAWIIVLSVALPLAGLLLGGVLGGVFSLLAWIGQCLDALGLVLCRGGMWTWDLLDWVAGRPVGWTPAERPTPEENAAILWSKKDN
jgi:hypothetical protein